MILGEVLFDHFPDGHQVLGGAPFNVAWNLQGLGLAPLFASAVGADDEGRRIRAQMESWGLATSALQTSDRWPTGKVRVELAQGQPTFHILDKQAYDDIQDVALSASPDRHLLMYQGSLAYRREPSRSTIRRLMRESGLPRYVDINIRQPWFDRAWIADLLGGADWIKLNDQELSWIAEMDCRDSDEIGRAVEKLRGRHGGKWYFITCGAAGAYAVDDVGNVLFSEAPKPKPLIDTVGAGDAFAAATIAGIRSGESIEHILQLAARFASQTCTIQGATTEDRDHYARFALSN